MSIFVGIGTSGLGMTGGYEASLGLAVTITLIVFLIAAELTASRSDRKLGRFLNVAIIPLFTVFAVIVATKVAEIL